MRILIVSNLYPPHVIGGYEQACHDTVEGLRARGHHVEVLTSTYGVERPVSAHGIHRLIRLHSFWTAQSPPEGWPALFKHALCSQWSLRALLRSVRPDIIYVWSMTGMPMSLLTVAQRGDAPIVFSIQDRWLLTDLQRDRWFLAWTYRSRSSTRRITKAALRAFIDAFVPTCLPAPRGESAQYISQAFAAIYAQAKWHFARERVIYNGIDTSHFGLNKRDHTARPYRMLFIGQLVPWKGAHTAIETLALLVRQRGRDIGTLTIVGASRDAAYQERLRQMVRAHALDTLVTFVGAVPRARTATLYAEHDVLLFPSSWIEGFSLVLLEALACALPVVGTITGGSAEILQDGVTGLTVPPNDAPALLRQAGRLIDDPALAHRLATTGATIVRQRFDQRHIIMQVEGYLGAVIEAARPCR